MFVALIGSSVYADNSLSSVTCSAGIKGGLFLFSFYGKDATLNHAPIKQRTDCGASIFFCIAYNQCLSGQIEISYSKKGQQNLYTYNSISHNESGFISIRNQWNESYKLDYLDIPVLLKFRIFDFYSSNFHLYTGPSFSFLLSANETIVDNSESTWIDIKSSTTPFDIGMVYGIWYEVPIGHNRFIVDVRYSKGFLTTYRLTEMDFKINPDAARLDRKNIGAMFTIGYAYAF